jgi:hypothetical protein
VAAAEGAGEGSLVTTVGLGTAAVGEAAMVGAGEGRTAVGDGRTVAVGEEAAVGVGEDSPELLQAVSRETVRNRQTMSGRVKGDRFRVNGPR